MSEYSVIVNGQRHNLDIEGDTPLLWVLRDELNMTGTKFGCGVAACGACSVMLNGNVIRSCSYPVGATAGMEIKTIEGLADEGERTAVQQAWIDHQVPQCGYCQSGMIMAVEAMLDRTPEPTDEDIVYGEEQRGLGVTLEQFPELVQCIAGGHGPVLHRDTIH